MLHTCKYWEINVDAEQKAKKKIYAATYYLENRKKLRGQQAEYYIENTAEIKIKRAVYYSENREDIRGKQAGYSAANSEKLTAYSAAWREARPDKEKLSQAVYYGANREKCRARQAIYYLENRAKIILRTGVYQQNNPGKANAKGAKRRAAKLNSTPAWANLEQIDCYYAVAAMLNREGLQKWHVDHIVPLQGNAVCGLHVPNNLQILTASENCRKNNSHQQVVDKHIDNW